MSKKLTVGFVGVATCLLMVFLWVSTVQKKAAYDKGRDAAYTGTLQTTKGNYQETTEEFFHRIAYLPDNAGATSADLHRLETLCSDSNFFFRAKAITALSWINQPEAQKMVPSLAKVMLADGEPLVRNNALNALRRIKYPDLRAVAEKMKDDPDEMVRKVALKVING